MFILDAWSRQEDGADYATRAPERQGALRERLRKVMRTNTVSWQATAVVSSRHR